MLQAPFLTAKWQHLVMFNYEVPPQVLTPFVPAGTYLDTWEGHTFVSLVGFLFAQTRVKGISIPWHTNFEEVNLRFYVQGKDDAGKWQRGVVFIKEIVPRCAIALTARLLYHEPYVCMPMQHLIEQTNTELRVSYQWRHQKEWNYMRVVAEPTARALQPNSAEAFITEHYWGYNRYSKEKTMAYQVEHPQWKTYTIHKWAVNCHVAALYGSQFAPYMQQPHSVLLADGSNIVVRKGFII